MTASPKRYDKLVYTRGLARTLWLVDTVGETLRRVLALLSPFWRQGQHIPEPARILVVRTEQIGDMILTTPALRALRARFPTAHIALLAQKVVAPVLQCNPDINEVIAVSIPWAERQMHPGKIPNPLKRRVAMLQYHWRCLKSAWHLGKALQQRRFDVAVDLGGHIYNLLVMALAKVPVRIGSPTAGGRFLLTHSIFPRDDLHEIDRCLAIVSLLGAKVQETIPSIAWTAADERTVDELLQQHNINAAEDLLVAIHPFSVEPSRSWSVHKWAKVADALVRHFNAKVLFIGSASEREKVAAIQAQMTEQAINLCGALSLLQVAALFKRCALMIGVNSAPAHLAAAVDTPLVSVWSAAYLQKKWAPRARCLHIVHKEVPCADCRLTVCPKPVSCMDLITPEEVIAAADTMLQRLCTERRA